MKLKNLSLRRVGVVLGSAIATVPAFAAVDTTAITTDIASAETAVLAIGGAVVLIFLGIALYKWIRRAF